MRIALLIGGRCVRYEVCLLPILQKTPFEVDLFMSINDGPLPYYEVMKEKLSPWLRGLYLQPFTVPEGLPAEFIDNNYRYAYQKINGEWKPRNQLSMFWNDNNAFQMAKEFAKKNGFVYDCFMKFRADLFNTSLPLLEPINPNELKLYSNEPACNFISFGIYPRKIVSCDWVWGNEKTMSIYCNTYDFVIQKLYETNGKYIVHFESCFTDVLAHNSVEIVYIKIPFNIDSNRKIFDKTWQKNEDGSVNDSRQIPPIGFYGYAFDPSWTTTEHIPVVAE